MNTTVNNDNKGIVTELVEAHDLLSDQPYQVFDDSVLEFAGEGDVVDDPNADQGKEGEDDKGGDNTDTTTQTQTPATGTEGTTGKQTEAPTELPAASMDYKNILLDLSKSGVIPQLSEDSEFQMGEGDDAKIIKFKDIEIKDKEQFLTYFNSLNSSVMEDKLKDKIDASGLSDITKKLIEVDKAGGDVLGLLNLYAHTEKKLEEFDIDTPEGKVGIVDRYLAMTQPHLSEQERHDMIEFYLSKGEDAFAARAADCNKKVKEVVAKTIEEEKTKAEQRRTAEIENRKKFKKGLKDGFSKYQLNDTYIQKAVEFGTKVDEDGRYALSKAYASMMENPETAADLVLFLMDKNQYDEQISNKKVTEVTKKTFKLITDPTNKNRGTSTLDNDKDKGIDINEKITFIN